MAPVFGIRHYAGEITYQADGFLDKNRDSLQTDMQELMQSSGHKLIADWFVDSSGDELSPSSPSSPSMDTISLSHSSLKVPKGGPSGSHQTINLEVLTHGKLAPGSPAPGHSGSLTRKKSAKLNTTGFQFNVRSVLRVCARERSFIFDPYHT